MDPALEMTRRSELPGFAFWPRFWKNEPGQVDYCVKEPRAVSVIEKTMYFDEEDESDHPSKTTDRARKRSLPSESSWFEAEDSVVDTTILKYPHSPHSRHTSSPKPGFGLQTIHPPRHDEPSVHSVARSQVFTPTLPVILDEEPTTRVLDAPSSSRSKDNRASVPEPRVRQYEQNWIMLSQFHKPNLMY